MRNFVGFHYKDFDFFVKPSDILWPLSIILIRDDFLLLFFLHHL